MVEQTPAEVKISELSIENESLKGQITQFKAENDELKKSLKQANDVIEGDIKARKAQKIMANSKYTIEDLSKMSVDEMKSIEKVLDMSNAPFKGIRPGSGDTIREGLTVPPLYGKTDEEIRKTRIGE